MNTDVPRKVKIRAGQLVGRAVKAGKLTRQPCEVCGEGAVDAHHDDYAKPLDVRWLCRAHHHDLHREARGNAPRPRRPPRAPRAPLSDHLRRKLVDVQARLVEVDQAYRDVQAVRIDAVREALAAGWTQQEVADAVGLTRGRINQIKETP